MRSSRRLPAGAIPLFLLVLEAALALPAPLAADAVRYREDRILVRLAPDLADALRGRRGIAALRGAAPRLEAVARSSGVIGWRARFPEGAAPLTGAGARFAAFWLAELAPGSDPDEAVLRLAAAPEVLSVERIAIVPVTAIPSDSLWSKATHLYQPSRRDVHAPEAWDVTRGDERVVVAILDTGILPYHPDLSGNGEPGGDRLWKNEAERTGLPGVDDDANGYPDDVVGWDFVALADSEGVFIGEDWRDEDPDPNDFAGHGTAVAGMVSAIPDNGIGVAGLGWNVRVMALRIGWSLQVAPLGVVDMSDAAAAVRYATRMGAHVINCSFASVTQSDFVEAIEAAIEAGVLVVTASGNNNSPNSIAHHPEVLAVTATDANDVIPAFATLGHYVDLAAPGSALPTTILRRTGSDSLGLRQPWYTTGATGTSFAAPLVSAAAALMQSRQLTAGERLLTNDELRLRLTESTDDISQANPGVTGFGTGRLNVERALSVSGSFAVRSGSATVGPSAMIDVWQGERRIALALASGHLLILSTAGDTLALAALPGVPVTGVSVGDGGDDSGPVLFVAVEPGSLCAYTADARPRPGWPVAIELRPDGIPVGPAIGDLDDDGRQEVVWGGRFSTLSVWHMSGEPFPGFPMKLDDGNSAPIIAVADVDGRPGDEILAGTESANRVYAIRHNTNNAIGWPVQANYPARSIGVVDVMQPPQARVYVAGGYQLKAFNKSGVLHINRGLTDYVSQDMAIADITGDGEHDVVLGLLGMGDAFHGSGSRVLGWPRSLGSVVLGPPVVGPLQSDGGSGILIGSELITGTRAYQALKGDASPLAGFPKPGDSGYWPTLAQLDDDDATEVIAGAGSGGLVYFYDAHPARWVEGPSWPTARGNYARTSSTQPVSIPKFDDVPPEPATNLEVSAGAVDVTLTWQSASDFGPRPDAKRYRVYAAPFELNESNAESAPVVIVVQALAGPSQSCDLTDLPRSTPYWFAVRSEDGAGNRAPISNVVSIRTPAPLAGLRLSVIGQPAVGDVRFQWYAAGGATPPRLVIFDVTGRVVRRLAPGPGFEGELFWDRRDANGHRVSPGLYFATFDDGMREVRTRIVLLR